MSSNAPPSDNETSPFPLNSSPLTSNNPRDVRVVTQSQERLPSQSQNLFSPNGQIDLLLQASEEVDHIEHQTPTILSSTIKSNASLSDDESTPLTQISPLVIQ